MGRPTKRAASELCICQCRDGNTARCVEPLADNAIVQ
jgi:hypothetical protein